MVIIYSNLLIKKKRYSIVSKWYKWYGLVTINKFHVTLINMSKLLKIILDTMLNFNLLMLLLHIWNSLEMITLNYVLFPNLKTLVLEVKFLKFSVLSMNNHIIRWIMLLLMLFIELILISESKMFLFLMKKQNYLNYLFMNKMKFYLELLYSIKEVCINTILKILKCH